MQLRSEPRHLVLEPMVLTTALHWNHFRMKLQPPSIKGRPPWTNEMALAQREDEVMGLAGNKRDYLPISQKLRLVGKELVKGLPQSRKWLIFAKGHCISSYAAVSFIFHHSWFLILALTWQIILLVSHSANLLEIKISLFLTRDHFISQGALNLVHLLYMLSKSILILYICSQGDIAHLLWRWNCQYFYQD